MPAPLVAFHHTCASGPSPASVHFSGHAPVPQCLVMRNLELNTVLKVQPHQHQVQGEDCFPSLAGHTISDTDKDAVGLCGHLCSQTSVRDYKLLRFGNFLNYTRNINFQSSPVLHLQHFGQEVCFGMLTPGDPLLTTQQRLQEQIILLKMKK